MYIKGKRTDIDIDGWIPIINGKKVSHDYQLFTQILEDSWLYVLLEKAYIKSIGSYDYILSNDL